MNYNTINDYNKSLQESFVDWQQQSAAMQSYFGARDDRRYYSTNTNQALIDLLKATTQPKMNACVYCYTPEEVTWALVAGYEKSYVDDELYIKWEK